MRGDKLQLDKDFVNIWELYGVKENPFSTSPLLVKGGMIPLESFVGRKTEITRIIKLFCSKGGSRILVYGDVGIGKTSFVNVARFRAMGNGFFTPFKEIATQSEWTTTDFILNTLAAIYATLKLMKVKPIKKEVFEKLENVVGVGLSDKAMGLQVAGFGGNFGKTRGANDNISSFSLQEFFNEVIESIKSHTENDIIIHYNNLELIPEKKLKTIFNNLRDFFQTPNVHFVFVGNLTTYSTIQSIPRISSILSDTPIVIEELSLIEVEEIIAKRIKALRIQDLSYIMPYRKDALESLYKLYGGNIRNILNSISTAINEVTNEKAIILTKYDLAKVLNYILEKRYLSSIQPRAKQLLLNAVKHVEITNKQLSNSTKIARPNVSMYLGQLRLNGCIYLRRKDGKDKFWSVDPKIKWALLEVKKEDIHQKSLEDFMV